MNLDAEPRQIVTHTWLNVARVMLILICHGRDAFLILPWYSRLSTGRGTNLTIWNIFILQHNFSLRSGKNKLLPCHETNA